MIWINPKKVTVTAVAAKNGLAMSGKAPDLRRSRLAPRITKIITLLAKSILISGARDMERRLANVRAAAASGTNGSVHSTMGFLVDFAACRAGGDGTASVLTSPPR